MENTSKYGKNADTAENMPPPQRSCELQAEIICALNEKFPGVSIEAELDGRGILTLNGECAEWVRVVEIGHFAAKLDGVKNVVNRLGVKGVRLPKRDYAPLADRGREIGVTEETDVLIIGAGISGCGIARELSKYKLDILVAEAGEDVATDATKANNGNIHPGHAVKPGTLKAELNIKGNRMYTRWAEELGFKLQRCGSMGAVTDESLVPALEKAYAVAKLNGVDGAEIIGRERAYELEPTLKARGVEVVAALWLPTMGLVEPYKVAVALAENAAQNGARFLFNRTVADILKENGRVKGAVTDKGIIKAEYVINCAGVYADEISEMAGDACYTIHPRKGVIAILDKNRRPEFNGLVDVYTPENVRSRKTDENTKGGAMSRTPEGNILMGPSASEIPDKDDRAATPDGLEYSMSKGAEYGISYADIIRFFSGNRPADYKEDFVIGMSEITDGFINVGAIQSPGLTSAPAIAEKVGEILAQAAKKNGRPLALDPDYNPIRKRESEFRTLSREERDALIKRDKRYGRIVCRCESVTEGEIADALRSPLPPTSIDAVKRRTRAGMGRCQGGFCQPRIVEIMAGELGKKRTEINLRGEGTNVLIESNRV
ncbi:MAG: NAD(P)/FAD-dependent oxidoreductase [Clostridiales bacterium]|jgi:glycerol-3-phosphate dehydrogenase|nr:NAD(P)/FAD-dependent oxidoreductase [Clostridiales bacterium]